jgi:hypothetical protein
MRATLVWPVGVSLEMARAGARTPWAIGMATDGRRFASVTVGPAGWRLMKMDNAGTTRKELEYAASQ